MDAFFHPKLRFRSVPPTLTDPTLDGPSTSPCARMQESGESHPPPLPSAEDEGATGGALGRKGDIRFSEPRRGCSGCGNGTASPISMARALFGLLFGAPFSSTALNEVFASQLYTTRPEDEATSFEGAVFSEACPTLSRASSVLQDAFAPGTRQQIAAYGARRGTRRPRVLSSTPRSLMAV
jgi:hypothetical protein